MLNELMCLRNVCQRQSCTNVESLPPLRKRLSDGSRGSLGTDADLAGRNPVALVPIIAVGAVVLRRVGAFPAARVTDSALVTRVGGGARDGGCRLGTDAGLAGGDPVALVPIIAVGAVVLRGVRAETGRGIAAPRVVALVERRANDRMGPDAGARIVAGVRLRAGVVVVARGTRIDGHGTHRRAIA